MLKSLGLAAVAVGTLAAAGAAQAGPTLDFHKGSVLLNARVSVVDPPNSSEIVTSAGAATGLSTTQSTSVVPTVGIDYFFTDNISAELVLGTSHHTIRAVGPSTDVVVRKTWVLPPILTLKYHFNPKGQVSPYLGAGLNAMFFYSGHDYNGFTTKVGNGVGVALQAGGDVALTDRVNLNLDVKKVFFRTDATINGGALKSRVRLDPWVFSAGIGYRF
jgi:outer membrane protein